MRKILILFILLASDLWACQLVRPVKFIPESDIATEILSQLKPQVDQEQTAALIYADPLPDGHLPSDAWTHYPAKADTHWGYLSILRTIGPLLRNCQSQFQALLDKVSLQENHLRGFARIQVKTKVYTNDPRLNTFVGMVREVLKAYEHKALHQMSLGDDVTHLQFQIKLEPGIKSPSISSAKGQKNLGNFTINLGHVPTQYLEVGEMAALIATIIQNDLPIHLELSLSSISTPNWIVSLGRFNANEIIKEGNKLYLVIFLLVFFGLFYKLWHKRGRDFKEKTTK